VQTRTVKEEALHTVLLPRDPVAGLPESPHIKKMGALETGEAQERPGAVVGIIIYRRWATDYNKKRAFLTGARANSRNVT